MTTTVEIPGWDKDDPDGTAVLRDPKGLTERYRRPLKTRLARIGQNRLREIILSQEDTIEGLTISVNLTDREADILMGFGDAVILALLESWTLAAPLPTSVEEVLDLPGHLYDALQQRTAVYGAQILAGAGSEVIDENTPEGRIRKAVVDRFTVDAVEDPASPTGASGG